MSVTIDLKRVNVGPGGANRERIRRQNASGEQVVPRRADVGIIPEPESLSTMIRSAIAAVRSGVYWDRGTILNIIA